MAKKKAAIETYSCSFQTDEGRLPGKKLRVIFLNILFRMHCE